MKYILIAAMLLPLAASAQIEVSQTSKTVIIGAVKKGGAISSELSYKVSGADTSYTIVFNNLKYQHIDDFKSFSFLGTGNALNGLYDVINTFFSDLHKKETDYEVNIKLGGNDINITSSRTMGITTAVIHAKGGFFYLTEKQVDKLFGK